MSMTRVVGLDPSLSSSGLALPNGRVVLVKYPKLRGPARLVAIRIAIEAMLVGCQPDIVVIEGYSYGLKGNAVTQLGELGGVLRVAMYELGMLYMEVPPTSLKKFATGKGNATKNDMVHAARTVLGYAGTNDDEADALWLRQVGLQVYGGGGSLPPIPPDRLEPIHALAWPPLA